MTDRIKLAVGLPAYGGRIAAEHARMFIELGHTLAASEERFELRACNYVDTCGVDRARNMLVTRARVAQADWLLMLDADTWIQGVNEDSAGFQLLRMISEADRAGAAVVGAPVVRRTVGQGVRQLNIYRFTALSGAPEERVLMHVNENDIEPSLFEVDAIGTAVLAIKVDVAGRFRFQFTEQLSEDLDFCQQVREAGGKIMADGRVVTAHLARQESLVFTGSEQLIVEKTSGLVLP